MSFQLVIMAKQNLPELRIFMFTISCVLRPVSCDMRAIHVTLIPPFFRPTIWLALFGTPAPLNWRAWCFSYTQLTRTVCSTSLIS